ncbi:hypothetical protein O0L34_g17313 [Tuta absoluta]|nr:hypothetical protein O0L34_g17313 [Tuta absoluta]
MQNHKFCLVILALVSVIVGIIAKPDESDPPPLNCPENEEYWKCKIARCFTICDHLVHIPPCPLIAPGCVIPGCLCKKGYLRSDQGLCIPITQCPQWPEADQSWWRDTDY